MAGSNDFTGQNIQDSYQRVLQLSSSGELADGTGSLVSLLEVTASYAISSSVEVTLEVSSSHAQTADNLSGLTTSVTELNHLDGITATNATQVKLMNQSVNSNAGPSFDRILGTAVDQAGTAPAFTNESGRVGIGFDQASDNASIFFSIARTPMLIITKNPDTNESFISSSLPLKVEGAITASGDISSSGTITAASYVGLPTGIISMSS